MYRDEDLPVPNDSPSEVSIRIVEQDDDVYEILMTGAESEITAITEMIKQGDSLVLRNLHVHGPGAWSSSVRELREAARQLGRKFGASTVIIYGARRTTGANPGRIPRPIIIQVGD